ncbi:MAG: HIT domain-containing protein [Pseudomonadales bacterium]|jgi:histidine triad (HIT) family protein|nr:HIT domain-containing protein [Pseudomonadales bacterium]
MSVAEEEDCVFCAIVRGEAQAWRVLETDGALAFFDRQPVCAYHTLVVPKRHRRDLLDADASDLEAVIAAVRAVCELYRERLGLQDFQVICSSGAAAQQDVFHLHFHVIPRAPGDGKDLAFDFAPDVPERFDALLERVREDPHSDLVGR